MVWGATPWKRANTQTLVTLCTYPHLPNFLYKHPMHPQSNTHSQTNQIAQVQVVYTRSWDRKITRCTRHRSDPKEPSLLILNLCQDVKWTTILFVPYSNHSNLLPHPFVVRWDLLIVIFTLYIYVFLVLHDLLYLFILLYENVACSYY